jgi:hypothetical protein
MKKLKIKIDQNGQVLMDAEGFSGSDCLEATKAILDNLSIDNKNIVTELKTEAYISHESQLDFEWSK